MSGTNGDDYDFFLDRKSHEEVQASHVGRMLTDVMKSSPPAQESRMMQLLDIVCKTSRIIDSKWLSSFAIDAAVEIGSPVSNSGKVGPLVCHESKICDYQKQNLFDTGLFEVFLPCFLNGLTAAAFTYSAEQQIALPVAFEGLVQQVENMDWCITETSQSIGKDIVEHFNKSQEGDGPRRGLFVAQHKETGQFVVRFVEVRAQWERNLGSRFAISFHLDQKQKDGVSEFNATLSISYRGENDIDLDLCFAQPSFISDPVELLCASLEGLENKCRELIDTISRTHEQRRYLQRQIGSVGPLGTSGFPFDEERLEILKELELESGVP